MDLMTECTSSTIIPEPSEKCHSRNENEGGFDDIDWELLFFCLREYSDWEETCKPCQIGNPERSIGPDTQFINESCTNSLHKIVPIDEISHTMLKEELSQPKLDMARFDWSAAMIGGVIGFTVALAGVKFLRCNRKE